MSIPIVLVLVVVVGMALFWVPAASQPPDDCERSCGNASIPFPFGLKERCYHNKEFLVSCNRSLPGAPRFTLGSTNINVRYISATTSEIEVTAMVAYDCFNSSGREDRRRPYHSYPSTYSISNKNKFVGIGCDTVAFLEGEGRNGKSIRSGCISTCNSDSEITNGSCTGVGCCEISFPKELRLSDITLRSFNSHSDILEMNPCSYAFIVKEGYYSFSSTDLIELGGRTPLMMPRLLDWAIGDKNCALVDKESDDFLCKGNSSECDQDYAGRGYRCRCKQGYDGNPYINDNCTNIDECKYGTHNCNGECIDNAGSYTCPCPNGQPGENRKDNNTCSANDLPIIQISVGTSVAGLFLLLLFTWIYFALKRRKSLILKEKFFKQNGGMMFEQRNSVDGGSQTQAKHFTAEELKKATNNYDESTIIGKGGYGTVYRGVLPDDRIVAIKKSKIVDQTQVEQFINEVIILSQVNHRNVVKLIGCCLQTEVPLLVYEFIPNGALFDHIHDKYKSKAITFDIRLRIATETAEALSYLYYGTSIPIIHRDIKSMNILLDSSYVAKVADFGASRLIPTDQNELATMVQGTLGYLDPEYFHTGQLTEKSDVYSFGVLLVELLTGKKIIDFDRPEEERQLTKYFIASLKTDTLLQVLDENLQPKEVLHDVKLVSELAQRCLQIKGAERPTMKEVASELQGICKSMIDRHPCVKSTSNEEETGYLLNAPSKDTDVTNNTQVFYTISVPR